MRYSYAKPMRLLPYDSRAPLPPSLGLPFTFTLILPISPAESRPMDPEAAAAAAEEQRARVVLPKVAVRERAHEEVGGGGRGGV